MIKIGGILEPAVEELGNVAKTAKQQIVPETSQKAKEETKEVVEGIYKPKENKSPDELSKMKANEKKELDKTRAKLSMHQQYFQRLTNPPKPKEEPAAKKVEREKMQDLQNEQEKQDQKPPPLAVQRAQKVERNPGVSG